MFSCCFQPKFCCIHFKYAIAWWKIIFQKSKRHLLVSFSSIKNMVGYILKSPKMNLWSDWSCFLAVFIQSFVVFTLNMLLIDGKSFFRSQKDLRFIYLWASVALEIWLVLYLYTKNEFVEWLVMLSCSFQPRFCCIYL